jgi:hypothetical protein
MKNNTRKRSPKKSPLPKNRAVKPKPAKKQRKKPPVRTFSFLNFVM